MSKLFLTLMNNECIIHRNFGVLNRIINVSQITSHVLKFGRVLVDSFMNMPPYVYDYGVTAEHDLNV